MRPIHQKCFRDRCYIYSARICIVALNFLHKLSVLLEKQNVGLYRDGELVVVNNANGPKLDKLRTEIIAIFKIKNFSITMKTNLIKTHFLGLNFLDRSKNLLYINMQSNHSLRKIL